MPAPQFSPDDKRPLQVKHGVEAKRGTIIGSYQLVFTNSHFPKPQGGYFKISAAIDLPSNVCSAMWSNPGKIVPQVIDMVLDGFAQQNKAPLPKPTGVLIAQCIAGALHDAHLKRQAGG